MDRRSRQGIEPLTVSALNRGQMMNPGIGVCIRRQILRRQCKEFVALCVNRIGMEDWLPIYLAIFQFTLKDHFDQLLLGLVVHRHPLFSGQREGRHRQELLMAGGAVLVTGMIYESFFGCEGGFLQWRHGFGNCCTKRRCIELFRELADRWRLSRRSIRREIRRTLRG